MQLENSIVTRRHCLTFEDETDLWPRHELTDVQHPAEFYRVGVAQNVYPVLIS